MIVWLASYPQSGNDFVRSLLSSYIFSKDGNFDSMLLENIDLFPNNSLFEQLGVNTENEDEMYKNYINSQKILNKKDSIMFLKTHSCFVNTEKFKFTDRHNTLGVVYIVRDPRNIIPPHSQDFMINEEQSLKYLLSDTFLGKESQSHCTTYLGSWKNHFNSWKKLNSKYLLIKYENLLINPENEFTKITKFIEEIYQIKFGEEKILKTIESCEFTNLQKQENLNGFTEATYNKFGKPINFFNLGPENNWEKLLDENIRKKIENKFENEMKELKYI